MISSKEIVLVTDNGHCFYPLTKRTAKEATSPRRKVGPHARSKSEGDQKQM